MREAGPDVRSYSTGLFGGAFTSAIAQIAYGVVGAAVLTAPFRRLALDGALRPARGQRGELMTRCEAWSAYAARGAPPSGRRSGGRRAERRGVCSGTCPHLSIAPRRKRRLVAASGSATCHNRRTGLSAPALGNPKSPFTSA